MVCPVAADQPSAQALEPAPGLAAALERGEAFMMCSVGGVTLMDPESKPWLTVT